MRNSYGVDDTVADAVRNLLNYFKPKEEGWFIPKDTLYNKNFSDGITVVRCQFGQEQKVVIL